MPEHPSHPSHQQTRLIGRTDHPRMRPAFNLIELVLVTVIVAIIAGVAIPHYVSALTRRRADSAVQRVKSDIQLTQRLSRNQSRTHRLRFAVDTSTYTIETTTNGTDWTAIPSLSRSDSAYTFDLAQPPYQAHAFSSAHDGDVSFVFDGFGVVTQSESIDLQVGKVHKRISVVQGGTTVTCIEVGVPDTVPADEIDDDEPGPADISTIGVLIGVTP